MEMTFDPQLLNKHVFTDGFGGAIFLFEPEQAMVDNPEGEGKILATEKDVLDFMSILDTMSLERNEMNALGLITVLLEKRAAGEMQEFA